MWYFRNASPMHLYVNQDLLPSGFMAADSSHMVTLYNTINFFEAS